MNASTLVLKAGAQCGSPARWDLRGPLERVVPTAIDLELSNISAQPHDMLCIAGLRFVEKMCSQLVYVGGRAFTYWA